MLQKVKGLMHMGGPKWVEQYAAAEGKVISLPPPTHPPLPYPLHPSLSFSLCVLSIRSETPLCPYAWPTAGS